MYSSQISQIPTILKSLKLSTKQINKVFYIAHILNYVHYYNDKLQHVPKCSCTVCQLQLNTCIIMPKKECNRINLLTNQTLPSAFIFDALHGNVNEYSHGANSTERFV